ncbi:MAG: magnesium/cobalt transporter CorA [Dehalococcoidales bacterium]|nr:magnesium/cobalt transporter CorA [Dehalococcoidales bacterium]
MPLKTYYLDTEGTLCRDLDEQQTLAAFESKQGLLWVDITEITEEDGLFMERVFRFHHLAVEDCVSPKIHPPKIDDFDEYLFMILHGVNYAVESEVVETAEIAIFIGKNYVVSAHSYPLLSVEATKQMVERDGQPMKRGADFLAYSIVDSLVDNVLPTVDKMTEIAEDIEEEIIRNPQQSTLEAILKLKRSSVHLHRVMAPQREVLNRISRGDFGIIKGDARIFYRDIYDHIVRIEDLNQTVRDMSDNTLSTYLSSVANRQNEVMKVLSIVAAIFLPLSLITGIFGMNFVNMPELNLSWGYYGVLGLIGFAILSVIGIFWARGWINWGRRRSAILRPFTVEKEKLKGYFGHLGKRQRRQHDTSDGMK